ncbi:signal peptidase I [Campylobacter concisus]|uniref:signal peptidase I n=1 Tax=Campylobacter concisus TaxID=199 RepID=UPI0011E7F64B|nr:signal peptidase I [Campylobacter concisus]
MKRAFTKFYDFCSSWTGTVIIVLLVIFFVAQAFVIPSGSMKNTLLVGDFLFAKKYVYGIPTPRIPWLEVKILPELNDNGHLITGDGPKRGDIVVFRYPNDEKTHFVKRCFATSEDEIVFTEKALYLRPKEGDSFIKANCRENLNGKESKFGYSCSDIAELDGKLFIKEPYRFSGIHYDENVNLFEQMVFMLNTNKSNVFMKPALISSLPQNPNFNFNAFYVKVPKDEYFMIGDNRDHSNDSRFWGSVAYKDIVGQPWFIYFSWDSNYNVRWERIGRFVDTIENDEFFTKQALKEGEVDGLH